MKVRKLKGADAKVFARVIGSELATLPVSGGDEAARRAAGFAMLQALVERHLETLWDWLADMGGMTAQELDEAPLKTLPELVQAIGESEDFTDFLDYVKSLVAKVEKSEEQSGS